MISVKMLKILIGIGATISSLSILLMLMDRFGYWGQGEYEFEFSIFAGSMQLFVVSVLITALCWRIHQLELMVDKLRRKQVKFDPKPDQQKATTIESTGEINLSEQQTNSNVLITPTQSTKNYILSIHKNKICRGNKDLKLTPKEFTLMKLLMGSGELCSIEDIIANVWPEEGNSTNRTNQDLNQLIYRLREKINIDGHDYIESHPGRGYEFRQWSE